MTVRRGDERHNYAMSHAMLLSIAIGATLGGLVFLTFPTLLRTSSLGLLIPGGLERGWALAYMTGGATIAYGFWRLDARPEVFGLMLLAGCYLTYGYAVIVIRGVHTGAVSASIYGVLGSACIARAFILRYEPVHAPWRRRHKPSS